jgi:hypothetical protein
VLIGIDEGADHPFGAVMIVVTDKGLVVVKDFLERMKANSVAHDEIWRQFNLSQYQEKTFAANKNALQLRLEWGVKGTGVIQAESKQEVGIQRTQSWLVTKKLKIAYTAKRTRDQLVAYRYADNTNPSTGAKKDKEGVFKLKDELPDGLRYALMAWPELPDPDAPALSDAEQARLDAFSEKTRWEIERVAENEKRRRQTGLELQPEEVGYPAGNVWQHDDANMFGEW